MRKDAALFLLISLGLSSVLTKSQEWRRNPCHPQRIKKDASKCQSVTLPKGFCSSCPFGAFTDDGIYRDCTRTVDLDGAPPKCFEAFNEYISLNPCDVPRKKAFFNYMNSTEASTREDARMRLDFFYYAYCEAGCDCIPQEGAHRSEPTIDLRRGNCQAHPYYDICKQSPDIKLIRLDGSSDDDLSTLPPVCPLLTKWFRNNRSWTKQATTSLDSRVEYFLSRLVDSNEVLRNSDYWNQCFDLETAQQRIADYEPQSKSLSASSGIWTDLNERQGYVARHECSFVQTGDHFYMFGGREQATRLDRYDYVTNSWDRAASSPLEFNHFQAVAHEGLIWVIGAFKTNRFPNEEPAETIYVYDPLRDAWMPGRNIPEHRRRGGAGLVVHDGRFYIVGGNAAGHNGGAVAWLDRYDPITNEWTELQSAPTPRDHFHAVLVGHKIYCLGGRQSDFPNVFDKEVAQIDVFDTVSLAWSTLPNALPVPRAGAAAAYFDGLIMLMGGESSIETRAYKRVDGFDPATGTFTRLADMNHGRHGTQAIRSGAGVFIAGGSPKRGGGRQRNMEVYGKNAPQRVALTSGVLEGPADTIQVSYRESVGVVVGHVKGNTGVFVNYVQLVGQNATFFQLTDVDIGGFLIPVGSTHAIGVVGAKFGADMSTATLSVGYNDGSTLNLTLSAQSTCAMFDSKRAMCNKRTDGVCTYFTAELKCVPRKEMKCSDYTSRRWCIWHGMANECRWRESKCMRLQE